LHSPREAGEPKHRSQLRNRAKHRAHTGDREPTAAAIPSWEARGSRVAFIVDDEIGLATIPPWEARRWIGPAAGDYSE
jgi:hypothetical protein